MSFMKFSLTCTHSFGAHMSAFFLRHQNRHRDLCAAMALLAPRVVQICTLKLGDRNTLCSRIKSHQLHRSPYGLPLMPGVHHLHHGLTAPEHPALIQPRRHPQMPFQDVGKKRAAPDDNEWRWIRRASAGFSLLLPSACLPGNGILPHSMTFPCPVTGWSWPTERDRIGPP